jgi:hypothetical protein
VRKAAGNRSSSKTVGPIDPLLGGAEAAGFAVGVGHEGAGVFSLQKLFVRGIQMAACRVEIQVIFHLDP